MDYAWLVVRFNWIVNTSLTFRVDLARQGLVELLEGHYGEEGHT